MQPQACTFLLNGRSVDAAGLPPTTTLLAYLRRQGWTGTKEGCAEGDCGTCTVVLVPREGAGRPRYQAINSCLVLLPMVAGCHVLTVEGLCGDLGHHHEDSRPARSGNPSGAPSVNASGDPSGAPSGDPSRENAAPDAARRLLPYAEGLHPVQAALAACGGWQCGYCTPGFVMSLFAAYCNGERGAHAVDEALAGNLCRCTGYLPMRRAAHELAATDGPDPLQERLRAVSPAVNGAPLSYAAGGQTFLRPTSLREAIDLLAAHPQARLVAGATDLGTSATAASSGSDLNGHAVKEACETLKQRLAPVAARLLGPHVDPADLVFEGGRVHTKAAGGSGAAHPGVSFQKLVKQAYLSQVSLSATGYYRTPTLSYDPSTGRGRPFHYFAYGAAASEVEVDGFTGEVRLLRVDILHDVGDSLNPLIDRGQIEGGFVQGVGWLTAEELVWDDQGRLLTHAPSTYKIPAITDVPAEFHVRLLPRAAQPGVIYGSKGVGEPPLMLALSVR